MDWIWCSIFREIGHRAGHVQIIRHKSMVISSQPQELFHLHFVHESWAGHNHSCLINMEMHLPMIQRPFIHLFKPNFAGFLWRLLGPSNYSYLNSSTCIATLQGPCHLASNYELEVEQIGANLLRVLLWGQTNPNEHSSSDGWILQLAFGCQTMSYHLGHSSEKSLNMEPHSFFGQFLTISRYPVSSWRVILLRMDSTNQGNLLAHFTLFLKQLPCFDISVKISEWIGAHCGVSFWLHWLEMGNFENNILANRSL